MPMSQACMDGISVHGLGWKHKLSLRGQTAIMGEMDETTPEAAVEKCALAIVECVRSFAKHLPSRDAGLRDALEHEADALEEVSDCGLVEVRFQMNSLYDQLDYSRVLVSN